MVITYKRQNLRLFTEYYVVIVDDTTMIGKLIGIETNSSGSVYFIFDSRNIKVPVHTGNIKMITEMEEII